MSNHLQAALHLSYFRVLKVDPAWNQTWACCFKVRWCCYSVKVSKHVSLKLRLLQYLTVVQVRVVQKMDNTFQRKNSSYSPVDKSQKNQLHNPVGIDLIHCMVLPQLFEQLVPEYYFNRKKRCWPQTRKNSKDVKIQGRRRQRKRRLKVNSPSLDVHRDYSNSLSLSKINVG